MKNGIYYNMSHEEYLAIDRPSFSGIKHLLDGFYEDIDKKEETPSMKFGTLFHKCILEPEAFDTQYTQIENNTYIIPNAIKDFKTLLEKEGLDTKKATSWEKAITLAKTKFGADKEYIKQEEYNKIYKEKDKVQELRRRMQQQHLLDEFEGGKKEAVVLWTAYLDINTSIDFKAKIDYFNEDTGTIIDLKTTSTQINKHFLSNEIDKRHYNIQLAFYSAALDAHNIRCDNHKFCFVNTTNGNGCIIDITQTGIEEATEGVIYLCQRYNNLIQGKLKPEKKTFTFYSTGYKYD